MGDIQYWQDTLTSEIESIRSILSSVPNISDDFERTGALEKAEKQLRSAAGNKRSFKMEVRILDQSARQTYETELANHEQNLTDLTNDYKALRAETSRDQLFVGASSDAEARENMQNDGDAMLNEASKLQGLTSDALGNTKSMIADSKLIGMSTIEDLQRQREQIRNIDDDVMRLEDNLTRADKLIKTFGKRMATDKVIQCFACTNVLMIVGVIIYAIVTKGGLTGDKDSGTPENPVGESSSRMLRGWLS